MKRDGNSKSLWQEGIKDFQPTNEWNKDEIYDVLIVGAGITGLTTALILLQEGQKCIVAEAHTVGFGTSGGTTAHINTLLDIPYSTVEKKFGAEKASLLARSTREAIDLIEGLVNKYHIDCDFSYQTGYLFSQNKEQSEELDDIVSAAQKAGVVCTDTPDIPISIGFEKAARFDFQAQIHATKYLEGLAYAVELEGGVILQYCRVNGVENNQHFSAETSLGSIKAKKVVYATHIPPGLTVFNFNCAPYRSYAGAYTLKTNQYPEGLVYDMEDPYHYFRSAEVNGKKYLVAGGFDHKTGHNDNAQYSFTQLDAYVRTHFDIDSTDYQWSSQYYVSSDGLPYIGAMPGKDGVFVATGFGGNGMTLGSIAAKVLCGLITTTGTAFKELFDPGRITIIAGFENFIKENVDVVGQYISGKFSYDSIKELAELAPGDAAIAKWEGKKVALYKEDNGHVYVLNPICPHAGCVVAWNNAEKSWDCPCHGARYAANGDLLNGPAMHGLTLIKWEETDGD